ncbi:uncharacterized protein TNCV_3555171 [Trichonephila clavipes]|nr:uncharacterized protein TNCV_3555171 [Trichonephila clavipes]
MTKSVVGVAAIVGYNRYHTPRHRIKEALDVSLGRTLEHCVQHVLAPYPVGIWLMASAECMGGPRAPTPQRCGTGCSVYQKCVLEHVQVKLNTTSDHGTGCKTRVAMHNATVQQPLITVSPNSNPTIVMLQAKAGFVSKHSVVTFRYPCPPFIAPLAVQTPVLSSQG